MTAGEVGVRLLAFFLIAEGVWSAFWIAGLLPTLAIYPGLVVILVSLRAVLAALACSSGWWLATGRPAGPVLARWALLGSACNDDVRGRLADGAERSVAVVSLVLRHRVLGVCSRGWHLCKGKTEGRS